MFFTILRVKGQERKKEEKRRKKERSSEQTLVSKKSTKQVRLLCEDTLFTHGKQSASTCLFVYTKLFFGDHTLCDEDISSAYRTRSPQHGIRGSH